MKKRSLHVIALVLTFFFTLPTPQLIASAQEPDAKKAQEKPQKPSDEETKLLKKEESKDKKEEERKRNEEKLRAKGLKKYQTLSDFAMDLYASDLEFKDAVDDAYLDLQRDHALQAYRINRSDDKDVVATENHGDILQLRRALYLNPRVQEYVNRLGQQIVPEDSEKLYSFKVFMHPIPQAYTLSTGTILISTGMISVLDNEAQLAYVLAHELAHVYKDHWRIKAMLPLAEEEYNKKQEKKRMMWAGLAAAAGAGIGAVAGGSNGSLIGAASGLIAGATVSSFYAKNINLDWNAAQEDEADDFALRATLGKSFDIQEVPRLYTVMAQVAKNDSRCELGFIGSRSRLRDRYDYAQKMLAGALQAPYQEALKANRIKGISPEFNLVMAELKRDNGIEAFYYDMFLLAKKNLEQAVMLRSDDALAAYYYGRVMKTVGRTKEDLDIADRSLVKAISLDVRHEIPEVQLQHALMLMDNNKDSSNNAAAITALKDYITSFERKRATEISTKELLPPNVDVLYGYMRLLGEKTWTAPGVVEVMNRAPSSSTPFQQAPGSVPVVQPASQTLSPSPASLKKKIKQ